MAGRKASGHKFRPELMNYGFSGLPCSGLPCSGLLLECGAFSCGALECCAGPRSTCGLPRASPCEPFERELLGTGRISFACRALFEGPEFGLEAATSRFTVFDGRSFRPTVLLAGNALTG